MVTAHLSKLAAAAFFGLLSSSVLLVSFDSQPTLDWAGFAGLISTNCFGLELVRFHFNLQVFSLLLTV